MTKPIFKRWPRPTGLMRVGYKDSWYIRVGSANIGMCVQRDTPGRVQSVLALSIRVKDTTNPSCNWRWARLKYKPTDVQDAKAWMARNWDALAQKYDICYDIPMEL